MLRITHTHTHTHTLELIKEFSKIERHKIQHTKISCMFIHLQWTIQNKLWNSSFYTYINKNETFRNELKVEEAVYTENQKTLERGKKKVLKKVSVNEKISVFMNCKTNMVIMSIKPKVICSFNRIPIKIPIFLRLKKKSILKLTLTLVQPPNSQKDLEKGE